MQHVPRDELPRHRDELREQLNSVGVGARLAAAVLIEAAEDDANELAGVLAAISASRREPETQRGGETLEIFDAGFVQTVGGQIHEGGGFIINRGALVQVYFPGVNRSE
jgi:hypothetical protein